MGLLSRAETKLETSPSWLVHVAAAGTVITTAATGSIGVLATAVGSERFFRNAALPFFLAALFTAAGLVLIGLAYILGKDKVGRRNLLAILALLSLGAALVFAFVAVARAGSVSHGPQLTVEMQRSGQLIGSIQADGLSGTRRLYFRVTAIGEGREGRLIDGAVGPGPDGLASVPVDVTVDSRSYSAVRVEAWLPDLFLWQHAKPDCGADKKLFTPTYSCIEINLQEVHEPSIALTFSGSGEHRAITGTVTAIPAVDEMLFIRVWDPGHSVVLHEAVIPGSGHRTEIPIDITVGQDHSVACVVAALIAAPSPSTPPDRLPRECPPRQGVAATWVRLRSALTPSSPPPGESPTPSVSNPPEAGGTSSPPESAPSATPGPSGG